MSLTERIDECTRFDLDLRVPLHVGGETWGQIRPDLVPYLAQFPEVFDCQPSRVALNPALDGYDAHITTRFLR